MSKTGNVFSRYIQQFDWSKIADDLFSKLVSLLLLFILFYIVKKILHLSVAKIIAPSLKLSKQDLARQKTITRLIENLLNYALYFLLIYWVLSILGLPVSSLLAGAGIADTGLIALLALTAVSCNRDEADAIIPAEKHENGILVANEGVYPSPNAELSYISRGFSSIKNDIYKTTNGENLGDVLQHVNFHNGEAYLVVNNSNKIIVTDRYTFQKKAEITQDSLDRKSVV